MGFGGRLAASAVRGAAIGGLALALGLGAAGTAAGQGWSVRGPGAVFLGAGVSRISIGELDDRLAARGYPTFGSTASTVSLGAYRLLPGGVMLGGEWSGVVFGEEAHDGGEAGLGGGYGTIGLGYAVELSPRARVYPRLGVGGAGLGMWLESEEETAGFDEVLADPDAHSSRDSDVVLARGSMAVDLGAGVELTPAGRGRGPLIGLRFGYMAAPLTSDWQLEGEWTDGTPVSGGPEATVAGPYLRLVVGWAWGR